MSKVVIVAIAAAYFLVACSGSSSETQTETSPETETTKSTIQENDVPATASQTTDTTTTTASDETESSAAVGATTSTSVSEGTTIRAQPTGAIISFGDSDSTCQSAKLTNASTDAAALTKASKCFLAEVEANKAVTVDIARPTVEGDPIFYRYFYNGDKILTIADTRADPFGDNSVVAKLCDKVTLDDGELLAENCEPADSLGFSDALG